MEHSENIDQIASALAKAQQETLFALTDSENPFFKSKYADLSSVWTAARKPLTDNGLSLAQPLGYCIEDGAPVVHTILMHTSGQWIKGECKIKPDKDGPQAVGSAITYMRRYSLAAMIGICPEDDDAESAEKRTSRPPPKSDTPPAMTDKQKKYLNDLMKKQGLSEDERKEFFGWHLKRCNKTEPDVAWAKDFISNFDDNYGMWNAERIES